MLKKRSKFLVAFITVIFIVSMLTACGQNQDTDGNEEKGTGDASAQKPPLLEYSLVTEVIESSKWANNPHDVVTPYIEDKFNIKVKEVFSLENQGLTESVNQWIAANNLPVVFLTSSSNMDSIIHLEIFADLEPYIDRLENLNKYFDQKYWPLYRNSGKLFQIPVVQVYLNDPKYNNDPYNEGLFAHALGVREDILEKCGYKFTPIDQIAAETTELGKRPTLEDFKIEPEIKTPEDLFVFLKKVKELDLKVGDKSVIPLTMISWEQFHFGTMYDFGHWRIDENGDVGCYLGLPGAKKWYRMMNRMYNEGVLDKDFLIHKDEQFYEKVESGRVACSTYVPNITAAQDSMQNIDAKARVRYIPWPKDEPGKGFFDIFKGGYRSVCINKDFEDIGRLMDYFDWFYSEEGLDIITWGPESADLWEIKDGTKVFKDKQLENDALNGVHGNRGADYYGLYDWSTPSDMAYWSKAANAVPFLEYGNPKDYRRSYPPDLNIYAINRNMMGLAGLDTNGVAAYGNGTSIADAPSTYFWGEFQNNKVVKVLTAKTDEEFNAAWDEIYEEFTTKGKYEEAVKSMKDWFDNLK